MKICNTQYFASMVQFIYKNNRYKGDLNMKKLNNGDVVFLKSGAMGVISKILKNYFGDNEDIYEITFINNNTIFKRSKDFSTFI